MITINDSEVLLVSKYSEYHIEIQRWYIIWTTLTCKRYTCNTNVRAFKRAFDLDMCGSLGVAVLVGRSGLFLAGPFRLGVLAWYWCCLRLTGLCIWYHRRSVNEKACWPFCWCERCFGIISREMSIFSSLNKIRRTWGPLSHVDAHVDYQVLPTTSCNERPVPNAPTYHIYIHVKERKKEHRKTATAALMRELDTKNPKHVPTHTYHTDSANQDSNSCPYLALSQRLSTVRIPQHDSFLAALSQRAGQGQQNQGTASRQSKIQTRREAQRFVFQPL